MDIEDQVSLESAAEHVKTKHGVRHVLSTRVLCVLLALHRYISAHRHLVHPVSVPVLYPREVNALWTQRRK